MATAAACGNGSRSTNAEIGEDDSCSATVTPRDMINPNQIGQEKTAIGVTLDRAMNSIVILDENGDSVSFDYAEVENRSKISGSNIGDTVTVKFVTLNSPGSSETYDSVTAIYRGRRP